jgi:hypothetical protein
MHTILILLAGTGTAYLASRMARHQAFQLADLLIGVFGGLAGISVAQFFGFAESSWSLGLPLLIACGLTLGLSSSRTARA